MKELKPPIIPTWLMDRFGVTRRNQALTGDLIEEFHSGRSRAWYWAHAFLALAIAARVDLWEHKLLAIRAFLIGEIAVTTLGFLFGNTVFRWMPRFHIGMMSLGFWLYTLGSIFVMYAVSGWIVGRLHRAYQGSMVLWFAFLSCCFSVAWSFPILRMHIVNSIDSPRFRPYLAYDLITLCVTVLATLIGGLAGRHDKSLQRGE